MDKIKNNSILEFNSILEKIINCSIKINYIIGKLEDNIKLEKIKGKEKNTDIDNIMNIIDNINDIYKNRSTLIDELKIIFDKCETKEILINNNELWAKYNNEIVLIEKENIEFLNEKAKETKNKLTELSNNKSLLIYNQKVKLSYENKLI